MSTVSALGSSYDTAAATASAGTATSAAKQKTLGQDDFLRLLAQQFQSQDPMKPMEDTSFIAQMAQFTSLQQASSMSKDMADMKAQQQVTTANSYLGHRVTVDVGQGRTASGDVTGVQIVDGTPKLIVGGEAYSLSSVLLVQPGTVASPGTNPNPTP